MSEDTKYTIEVSQSQKDLLLLVIDHCISDSDDYATGMILQTMRALVDEAPQKKVKVTEVECENDPDDHCEGCGEELNNKGYCDECGPFYCTECGESMESDTTYCDECLGDSTQEAIVMRMNK